MHRVVVCMLWQSSFQVCKWSVFGLTGQPQNSVDHITWLMRERQRATIDGLELGELLGRGSFGRVYKGAFHAQTLLALHAHVLLMDTSTAVLVAWLHAASFLTCADVHICTHFARPPCSCLAHEHFYCRPHDMAACSEPSAHVSNNVHPCITACMVFQQAAR